MDRPQSQKIM